MSTTCNSISELELTAPRASEKRQSFLSNVRDALKTHTEAKTVKSTIADTRDGLKRMGLSHILYVGGLIVFTILGAAVFYALDGEAGDIAIAKWENRCTRWIEKAEYLRHNSSVLNRSLVSEQLYSVIYGIDNCYRKETNKPGLPMSNFANAMIFAITCYTTIGYGTIFPTSKACKSASMVFIMIGIPYFLALMIDVGHFLRIWFQFAWVKCRKCINKRRLKFNKKTGLNVKAIARVKRMSQIHRRWLPFILACIITLGYVSLLAWFFVFLEYPAWTFYDAFYFVLQTITLVGFGDIYPTSVAVLQFSLPLLIAIVFLMMCFILLQEGIQDWRRSTTIHLSNSMSNYARLKRTPSSRINSHERTPLSLQTSRSWSHPCRTETEKYDEGKRIIATYSVKNKSNSSENTTQNFVDKVMPSVSFCRETEECVN